MTKKELSVQEVAELLGLFSEVFVYISELKRKKKLAENIQYPKLPSILTESIILHLLRQHIILPDLSNFQFKFGGNIADIIGSNKENDIKIEVKGTVNSFQYFGPKDINADYLIWIYLGETDFSKNRGKIRIYILKPRGLFKDSVKITIKTFLKDYGDKIETLELNLQDVLSGKFSNIS